MLPTVQNDAKGSSDIDKATLTSIRRAGWSHIDKATLTSIRRANVFTKKSGSKKVHEASRDKKEARLHERLVASLLLLGNSRASCFCWWHLAVGSSYCALITAVLPLCIGQRL